MSPESRIWFPGNPWPEGHPIEEFEWTVEVRDGVVWMLLHLMSASYYSEREIEEGDGDGPHWEESAVWANFERCTMSSTHWHHGGFPVCPVEQYSAAFLDGWEAHVDSLPRPKNQDTDDHAFQIYLLGHDDVAGHHIGFLRRGDTDRFDVQWAGKVALSYFGDTEYAYDFKAQVFDVPMPTL